MNSFIDFFQGRRRRALTAIGLGAVLAAIVVTSAIGLGKGVAAPIWSDRPIRVAPATVQTPNWVELATVLKPAVVNINTKRVEQGISELPAPFRGNDQFDQFFKQFFGTVPPHTVRSLGSGFIINSDGYVVTNNHVVDNATTIQVKLADGREFPAKVVGRDPKTDLVLVKIAATGLPVIPVGRSSSLRVGEPVMAIGNPFGLEQTVTTGIVSATGRVIGEGPYDDFIQTDASINPGNSGGPLINARGEAVGINTAIFSQSGGSVGIGFAIPIDLAKSVVAQLAATGHVVRGWLGVSIQRVSADLAKSFDLHDTSGALVASVVEGSPAMKAGLKSGDVITEYNGVHIARSDALPRAVAETQVGREVPVTVLRNGRPLTLTVTVGKLADVEHSAAVASHEKTTLGLSVQMVTPEVMGKLGLDETHGGVLVRGVEPSSAADNAGLQPGDVILEVDHHPVKNVQDLKHDLDEHRTKTPVVMLIHRNGDSLYVAVAA